MKRLRSHASRRIFGLGSRRRTTEHSMPFAERSAFILHLVSKNALAFGLAALMVISIGLLMVNFVGQVLQSARLDARRAEMEAEVAAIRAENGRLTGLVEYTESPVYTEMVARSQLGFAREGDVVILSRSEPVTPPDFLPSTEELISPVLAPQPENWRLWWRAFFPG
ncbi:MAG: septum formation initiator family protein [Candidatus Viridilinea halotolerans]|uniref:Septum formation initiator family protein n=1 Tax=Candidatus Viridilinea halotolerans TaxID=2491704 RepID=A0A426U329_9CHLR|nr:MAG: septum formation initiator family protein [Candidatus Viridilinea halotolerans]